MEMQIIGLWIGLFITFVMGLINFLWGPAILTRREMVIIREPQLKISLVERNNGIERIFIESNFKLVRTRGAQDLYLESAYVQLSETWCEKLGPYFRIPPENRIYWKHTFFPGEDEEEYRTIKINQPKEFKIYENFNPKSSLRLLEKALQQGQNFNNEDFEEKQEELENLKKYVRKLEVKYMIVWFDGKGKEWQYRIPKKWWDNILPRRVWWRMASTA